MFTQLIITIVVIACAVAYLRQTRRATESKVNYRSSKQIGRAILWRYGIYALVSFSILASGSYWTWDWFDGNQIVNVTIISPIENQTMTYQVRKRNITTNEIVTLDGIHVRLSNQERIVIAASTGE